MTDDHERALSEAHDRGYTEGENETAATFLLKFDKWLKRRDTKAQMQERVDHTIDEMKKSGRWPKGW